jgi:hypothetical protein
VLSGGDGFSVKGKEGDLLKLRTFHLARRVIFRNELKSPKNLCCLVLNRRRWLGRRRIIKAEGAAKRADDSSRDFKKAAG